jgi:hypothetical protein
LREAFGQGRIGWSALKVITRVTFVDSQTSWIDFAREHGVERTLAEARDALRRVGTRAAITGRTTVTTSSFDRGAARRSWRTRSPSAPPATR